jgi:DNA-binding Lrp family transcriptional regulator
VSGLIEAFVLVSVKEDASHPDLDFMNNVKKEIVKLKGVKEVNGVFGLYDFVIRVETETPEEMGILVTQAMRAIKGVTQTETMIIGF